MEKETTYYKIDSFIGIYEEDNFKNGQIGPRYFFDENHVVGNIYDNQELLINGLCIRFGISKCDLDLNSCGEKGRIDFDILRDEYGEIPTENDIKRWKLGKVKLYNYHYSFHCVKIVEKKFEFS